MDLRWRKSSRSQVNDNSDCVEVALAGPGATIRDSKNPGPRLLIPGKAWSDLRDSLR